MNDIHIPDTLLNRFFEWMGRDNIIWFKHIKGLKGQLNCVLKLNYQKKKIPVHPIHLREGMAVRNFLRMQPECKEWQHEDFEHHWVTIIEKSFQLL